MCIDLRCRRREVPGIVEQVSVMFPVVNVVSVTIYRAAGINWKELLMPYASLMSMSVPAKASPAAVSTSWVMIAAARLPSGQNQTNGMLFCLDALSFNRISCANIRSTLLSTGH
jgi:hypothetical protein